MEQKFKRPSWKKILIVLDIALIILVALEGFTRLVYPQAAKTFYVHDEVLGWRNKPNTKRINKNPEYEALNTVNSRGLRGTAQISFKKPEGIKRVLVLGDSYTWGEGVNDEETYAYLLNERLGKGYEVLNAGVDAYGTDQEYLYLKEEGYRYQPDIVVLAFCPNDLENNALGARTNGPELKPRFVVEQGALRHVPGPSLRAAQQAKGLGAFLGRHSHLYRLSQKILWVMNTRFALRFGRDLPLVNRLLGVSTQKAVKEMGFRNEGEAVYSPYLNERPVNLKKSWEVSQRLILETKKISEGVGARFVLVTIPYAAEIYPRDWEKAVSRYRLKREQYDLDRLEKDFSRFAEKNGITWISLKEGFTARKNERVYFETDLHLNAVGHSIAAEAIEKRLRVKGEE